MAHLRWLDAIISPMLRRPASGALDLRSVLGAERLAVYVHIPFCRSLCAYCVFNRVRPSGQIEAYIAALEQEIAVYGRQPRLGSMEVGSVFIGGGTPSFLAEDLIERVLGALHRHLRVAPDAQISLESNPESLTRAKLQRYRAMGVQRLSIGVQSFDERLLRRLGRRHRQADIHRALEWAASDGPAERSIDLMFGLPGQSLDGFSSDLDQAIGAPVGHLSLFAMLYKPQTPLWRHRVVGRPLLRMWEHGLDRLLAAGFEQYTTEDFTRSGVRCRYQEDVWRPDGSFLGLGAGALSQVADHAWHNIGDVDDYIASASSGSAPIAAGSRRARRSQMRDHLLTAMKGMRVDPADFDARFGVPLWSVVGPLPWMLRLAGLLARDRHGAWVPTRRGSLWASMAWGGMILDKLAHAGASRGTPARSESVPPAGSDDRDEPQARAARCT